MKRSLLVAAMFAAACGEDRAPAAGGATKPAHPRGLIVLGIDGMDPVITRRMLAAGELPNLAKLVARGGFSELDTTSPPQSPVAWSTFITGLGPEGHGIFDFVHRDATHLAPYLSTAKTSAPDWTIELGPFAFAIGSPEVTLLRDGRAFWQLLEDAGVPATVFKVPANFPPAPSHHAESSSGMGTPDLLGTYGTFQLFTDDPAVIKRPQQGGLVHALDFGGGQRARAPLSGPPNPTRTSTAPMELDVEVVRDRKRDAALIRIGGAELVLAAGEWSEWQPVAFEPGILGGEVGGMVRVYLRQVRPTVHLYVSPINLDPLAAAMPVSSPPAYAAELAHDIGRFYTQGMPEDTKALAAGAVNRDEFLDIVDTVMTETEAALDRELARFHGGFLFVYLSSIDQTSHVFFRSLDPDAPAAERAYADVIPALYRRVDKWLPKVLERAPAGTELVVMSDHGFAPYHTKVHLNTFLAQRGYLTVLPPERQLPGPLGHIDWTRTQAYALGLNQLFLNASGREAHGAVDATEREVLLRRLEGQLLALRDPERGETAITRLDRAKPGAFPGRAPDLIVGYRRGYRSSDESALGAIGDEVFAPNHDVWSGDHCMDPAAVPGVVASGAALELDGGRPSLDDLAPTILQYFDVPAPPELGGRSFLKR